MRSKRDKGRAMTYNAYNRHRSCNPTTEDPTEKIMKQFPLIKRHKRQIWESWDV